MVPMATLVAEMYKWNGIEGFGGIKIGGDKRYFFIWLKAS